MMNRREMIQRVGLFTALGALFPRRMLDAHPITPKPSVSTTNPEDDFRGLRPSEREILTRLRADFPEFIIRATPLVYDNISFAPWRGLLCQKRGEYQKPFLLNAAFPSIELIQDATALHGLDVIEEVYRATRQEVAFEILVRYGLPKNLSPGARDAILYQMRSTHPADYYRYPFRLYSLT